MEGGWKVWMRLEVLEHPTNELVDISEQTLCFYLVFWSLFISVLIVLYYKGPMELILN